MQAETLAILRGGSPDPPRRRSPPGRPLAVPCAAGRETRRAKGAMPVACLLAMLLAQVAAAEEWKAADQAGLKERLDRAKELKVEDVATPVVSMRLGMLLMAPNPDAKSYDLLQIYFPQYGGPNTIVIADLGSGEVKQVSTERGPNFHLCPSVVAPNGKLYISILGPRLRQQVCTYDPAKNEFLLNALPLPDDLLGETHPMALGTDGKIYMAGGHPSKSATACQIDPATNKVTSYGPVGPSHAPNDCWAYSAAADDRYIYIASGKVPWYLVAYDRQTGKAETLITTEKVGGYLGAGQGRGGCTANASKVVGTDGNRIDYWLYQGKAVPMKDRGEKPPWPERPAPRPALPPQPEVSLARAVPDAEGRAEIWCRTPEAKAAAPAKPAADATLESRGWRPIRFRVPIYPQAINRLVELPDGRLFGAAGSYEGNFIYDPATGKSAHPGKSHLSHYATAICGGKIYMSGYPNSPLYVYDPAKPWTAGTEVSPGTVLDDGAPSANPRRLLYMSEFAGTHKMYAAAVGADGRIYFGGQWMRSGSAGGLAWYDPKTEKAGGFWEPFSTYQITHMAAASQGRPIVISTKRIEDTLLGKPKPKQGRLFVFDTKDGKIVREIDPVMDAKGSGMIVAVGGPRVLGWTVNGEDTQTSVLYGVDAEAGTVGFRTVLPYPLPVGIGSNQQEAFDFRLGPDGKVWTFIDNRLVRIDPKDAGIQVVGRVAKGGRLAFSGKDVYLGAGPTLRRITGLLSSLAQ